MTADHKENIFKIFIEKCLLFYTTVKAYLKLRCDLPHSTKYIFNYELKIL